MPLCKETIQFRKDNNLCERCGQLNAPDRKMCRKHLDQVAVRQDKQRAKKKRLGICERCKNPVIPNEILCVECKPKVAQANCVRNKKRYKKRKVQSICMTCDDPAESGKTQCRSCLDNRALEQRAIREHRLANNLCIVCAKYLGEDPHIQMCDKHSKKRSEWYVGSDVRKKNRVRRIERKKLILAHYGGKCKECGEDHWAKLAIDHLNNDGNKHRKEIKKHGSTFYEWLVNNNFPEEFQILCHNCNWLKYYELSDENNW